MNTLFKGCYKGTRVLVTGHTGFKGSWLIFWLKKMGAHVIGYSLEAPTSLNHIGLLNLDVISIVGDIKDAVKLDEVFERYKPEIVFHLAAQALVKLSYEDPIETYETNIIGTLKVFEACKKAKVKAIINVTSDKAYENKEWVWGYRESDQMGGYDPYSSSKGCAELLANSYRNSFFNLKDYKKKHNTLLASCRAGNVIGGGDWATDRLVSDIMVSVSAGKKVSIRNPHATRPWQHVLEPLSGYLHVGQKLLQEDATFAEAWNFGPSALVDMSVLDVVENIKKHWEELEYTIDSDPDQPHEANLLKLDCSKAIGKLKWQDVWGAGETIEITVKWYKSFYENSQTVQTEKNLDHYIVCARSKNIEWSI